MTDRLLQTCNKERVGSSMSSSPAYIEDNAVNRSILDGSDWINLYTI